MKVFIDTSAFVALFVEKEGFHQEASRKYRVYREERAIFFTSNFILDELFTRMLFYKEVNIKELIKGLKRSIALNELTVLQIDETLFEKALDIFQKFSEHKISFTDATTYCLYKDFALDEIFTLDNDFKKMRLKTSL